MPMIWIPDEELKALQGMLSHTGVGSWQVYHSAKRYIMYPLLEAPHEVVKAPPVVKSAKEHHEAVLRKPLPRFTVSTRA